MKVTRLISEVTAFGFGENKHRSLQQYTVQPRSVVAKVTLSFTPKYWLFKTQICLQIPDSLSFDQASTIPDNFVTAFYTLFNQLGLPKPSSFPATQPPPLATTPILIYGASSTAGLYAVQLLSLAGYKKIIAIASKRNHDYLRSLGATDTFDYNSSTVVEDIAVAIGGDGKALLALDCISTDSTLQLLAKIISPLGKLAILLPIKEGTSVTGGLDEEMYWDINYEKTPIPKETQVIGVRTFLYLEVCYAICLFPENTNQLIIYTGRVFGQESHAKNSSGAAPVGIHQTYSSSPYRPGNLQRECYHSPWFTSKQQNQRRKSCDKDSGVG